MSRYGYDYALAPSRSTGWRSGLANVLTIVAIAAISAISGGAVALNLLGPGRTEADRPVTTVTHARPASVPVARAVTPATPPAARAPVKAAAAVAQQPQPKVPAPAPQPKVPAAPQPSAQAAAAPAPQAAPAAVAAVEEATTVQVPESNLTFTHGYARRRAVQAAAEAAAPKIEVARAEAQTQLGRAARFRAVARAPQDQRRVAERGDERFDFGRHQALAYGDPRANRRPPPQGGGLFSHSPGGFFGGVF